MGILGPGKENRPWNRQKGNSLRLGEGMGEKFQTAHDPTLGIGGYDAAP